MKTEWSISGTAQLVLELSPHCLPVRVTGRTEAAHKLAALLEAAPDLLAACEFYERGDLLGFDVDGGARARAAIAKARG